jgi:hypothetical protein
MQHSFCSSHSSDADLLWHFSAVAAAALAAAVATFAAASAAAVAVAAAPHLSVDGIKALFNFVVAAQRLPQLAVPASASAQQQCSLLMRTWRHNMHSSTTDTVTSAELYGYGAQRQNPHWGLTHPPYPNMTNPHN